MKLIGIGLLILLVPAILSGQRWRGEAGGNENYHDLVARIEAYYATHDKGRGSGYKQFMRWRGMMEPRVGPSGEMKNYDALNYQAYRKIMRERSSSRAVHGTWQDLGPTDYYTSDSYSGGGVGRVNCMAFHPSDPDIFWIGTPVGGLWKTTDDGETWNPMTDHFASIGISGIVVDQTNPDVIYVLTGDGAASNSPSIGVMKTTNGGITWQPTGLQFGPEQRRFGYKLLGHPVNPDILFATFRGDAIAPGTGIYRTLNGGQTWTQVLSLNTVWDIEFRPGSPDTMYAAASNNTSATLMRSTDAGLTWMMDDDSDFPDTCDRMAIAICPSVPDKIYAVFGGDFMDGAFRGFYMSTDNGQEFVMQSNTPNILGSAMSGDDGTDQAWRDLAIIVDPDDDTKVFVAAVCAWKSENSGASWQRETWWRRDDPLNPYVHADFQNLYFQNGWLYANNDGGIYRSDNFGHSWQELTNGLSIMQFYEIDILNDEYIGGTQDNGTNGSNVSNPQAHNLWGGDGFGCTWHTGDNSIQYISTQNAVYRRQFGTSIPISPIDLGDNDFWFTQIEMHTTNPDYVFVSTFNEIYRGNGDAFGFSWDSLRLSDFMGGGVTNFVQGVSNPDVMYACNGTNVYRCNDISATSPTWSLLSTPFNGIAGARDVETDPAAAEKLWVCLGGYVDTMKVFFSPDSGLTWVNISDGLPNVPMICLVYEPGSNDGIYVGTEIGVFYRNAAMSSWIYFGNLLPNTRIEDLEIFGNYIYAGTFGRGIWRSETYTSCPYNLVLTPGNDLSNPLSIGTQHYHAENNITSTRLMGGNMAEIFYSAGNYIDMLEGFWSKQGNFLEVQVDGCPD